MEWIKQVPKKLFIVVSVVLVALVVYLIGVSYFNSHFLPRSYAGPIKVSQMTVEHATQVVEEGIPTSTLMFQEADKDIGFIELNQLDIRVNTDNYLGQALQEQNAWLWPFALIRPKEVINIKENIQLDEQLVEALIPNLGVENSDRTATQNAFLVKDEQGVFEVQEEVYGNQVNSTTLTDVIKDKISEGNGSIKLEEAYDLPTELAEGEIIQNQLVSLERMKNTSITLEFAGNSVTIPQELIETWIYVDEEGQLQVDAESVDSYIVSLNEEYSGLLNTWTFTSTYQGEVQVQPGTYGWYIDRFEEAPIIIQNIHDGAQLTREPIVYGSSYGKIGRASCRERV